MNKKAWLIAAGGLLLCLLLTATAAWGFEVVGLRLWSVGGALLLLWTAGLVFYLALRPRKAHAAGRPGLVEEVSATVRAAQAQLAGSGRGRKHRLNRLPMLLWMGPPGSTKTTTIVNSGLEPELLAGAVERGGAMIPTEPLALWYAQGTVVLEAGSPAVEEQSAWSRLLKHVRPARIAAVFARGAQAPRMAVVCFPCDEFFKPGGAESVVATARQLRARLGELARTLGTRVPVYVLFTKADRLAYFSDFVRTMTPAEAQEVLGATLPLIDPVAPGLHADAEGRRLHEAFRQILHSLALRRADVLARDGNEAARHGAYEFPRELRKVSDLAIQFMVELGKPSQLHESPFLRGFYFTGMRTVLAADAAPQSAPEERAPQLALGATTVFDPRKVMQSAAAGASARGSREVTEAMFVRRIFRDVVLRDHAAMKVTAGGTRVNHLRRGLVAAAAVACLLLNVAFTVSYRNNRRLLRDVLAASTGAGAIPREVVDFAPVEDLTRLEALREQAARLSDFDRGEGPLRYHWGLYAGDRIHPGVRTLYFDRFSDLLWGRTRSELLSTLEGLPDAPTGADEYGDSYDVLKAYLVTTSHPEHSTGSFLAPVLTRLWTQRQEADAGRREIARRQFEFFGDEIPQGNPFADRAQETLVAHARSYLAQFAQTERFYTAMLASASRAAEDIHFNRMYPGSEAVLRNDFVVPGAFTRGGWEFVQGNGRSLDQLFSGEEWVLGRQVVSGDQRTALARELRARYVADYIRAWQQFLDSASVAGFSGAADAAQKLAVLSGPDSPLLQMLVLASQNTDVDSATVGQVFQPVRQVVPAKKDLLIVDSNRPYVTALGGLQSAMGQVAAGAGAPTAQRAQLLMQAMLSATQAEGEAGKLAQQFRLNGGARAVGESVQRLLLAPIKGARALVSGGMNSLPTDPPPGAAAAAPPAPGGAANPGAELNQRGEQFCRAFRDVTRKFPFAQSREEASLDELSGLLQPGNSAMSEFYDGALKSLLRRQGSRYLPRLGASPVPSEGFIGFFNRVTDLSSALYDDSGAGPELQFSLRPQTSAEIPEVGFSVEGKSHRYTRTVAASESFTWRGGRGQEVRLNARVNGRDVTVASEAGTWGLFRIFRQASWESVGEGQYLVRWRVPGAAVPLSAQVIFARGVPVLDPEFLGGLGCVSRVTN
jgi:type VI secretion system protein ImpL